MEIINDELRSICIICLRPTDLETLRSNQHCCDRSEFCKDKFREITNWEKGNFGNSLLEQLSRCY